MHGKITITGFVGGGRADSSAVDKSGQGPLSALGSAAANGGYVELIAPTIDVVGQIAGNRGGTGGNVSSRPSTGWVARSGEALGADGGLGGDVVLCALRAINVSAGGRRVAAGNGGSGSDAVADSTHGVNVESRNLEEQQWSRVAKRTSLSFPL